MTLLSFPTGPELRASKLIMRIRAYETQTKKSKCCQIKTISISFVPIPVSIQCKLNFRQLLVTEADLYFPKWEIPALI